MKLTAAGKTAIQALLDLAQNSQGEPVNLKDISKRQGISLHFLEQIFRRLRVGGVVKSIRGPGGGYVLACQKAEKVTLKTILHGIGEGTSLLGGTSANQSGTPEEKAVHRLLSEVDTSLGRLLENLSLRDLQADLDAEG